MKKYIKYFLPLIFMTSISGYASERENNSLLEFSHANCLFWYFKDKGYDTKDIRAISSGIVEMSDLSADKFSETAFLVKNYTMPISSKANIDRDLNKCFYMLKDEAFIDEVKMIYDK